MRAIHFCSGAALTLEARSTTGSCHRSSRLPRTPPLRREELHAETCAAAASRRRVHALLAPCTVQLRPPRAGTVPATQANRPPVPTGVRPGPRLRSPTHHGHQRSRRPRRRSRPRRLGRHRRNPRRRTRRAPSAIEGYQDGVGPGRASARPLRTTRPGSVAALPAVTDHSHHQHLLVAETDGGCSVHQASAQRCVRVGVAVPQEPAAPGTD